MMNTNPKTEIIFAHFKIDEQLSDILLVATDLYSRLDSLIDSKKYNHDKYPGNEIDELFDEVGNIMCKLGDVIGRDIALQAFDLCKNKEGGEA